MTLIDTLPEDHFCGAQTLYARPGHIPGAKNVSILNLYDASGHFKPDDELAALFDGSHSVPSRLQSEGRGQSIALPQAELVRTPMPGCDVAPQRGGDERGT